MYILPMLPMVALAAAPYLEEISVSRWLPRLVVALASLLAAMFVVAGALALTGEPGFELKLEAERGLAAAADQLWWLLGATGVAMVVALLLRRRNALHGAATAFVLLIVMLYSGAGLLLDDENSARTVMRRARALAGPQSTIGLVAWKEQNLLQARGPTAEFGFLRTPEEQLSSGLAWLRVAPGSRRLFVLDEAMGACVRRNSAAPVGTANRRHWYLLDAGDLVPDCDPLAAATGRGATPHEVEAP
jgi:hypothetical protein